MKERLDCTLRFTTQDDDLPKRLNAYIDKNWGKQHGVKSVIIKRALREFLDREEKVSKR